MKNNSLNKKNTLSIALLTLVAFQVSFTTLKAEIPSPAAVVATLSTHQADAVRFIKDCFDAKRRKIDFVTVDDFLTKLGIFHESFLELKNVANVPAQNIFDCINKHMDSLPQELQELFQKTSPANFDIIIREKRAMEHFHALLTGPINRIPKWTQYVDQMTTLLAGNTVYGALRNDLVSLRKKSGWFGKIAIARKLNNHKSSIPHKLRKCIENMSTSELSKRVKN